MSDNIDNKDKLNLKSESNTIDNEEDKEDKNLNINNYGRFSNDNIFDYQKKNNDNNLNNQTRNPYEINPYQHKTNDQSISNGSILSQAAKSNLLI